MEWKDYAFIFGMSVLVLVAKLYGVNGEFLAFIGGAMAAGGVLVAKRKAGKAQ